MLDGVPCSAVFTVRGGCGAQTPCFLPLLHPLDMTESYFEANIYIYTPESQGLIHGAVVRTWCQQRGMRVRARAHNVHELLSKVHGEMW